MRVQTSLGYRQWPFLETYKGDVPATFASPDLWN